MANLNNQKTFLQIQQEVSETALKKNYPNVAVDGDDQPGFTRLCQMINDAYSEICTEQPWSWRFNDTYNFNTVAGQITPYTLPNDCEEILDVTIPLYQQRLWATLYSQWITNYPGQYTNYANAKPWAYIQAPDAPNNETQIYLFPASDQVYSVHVPYMSRPVPLANPTDILYCPPEYQDLVISRTIFKVYKFLGDPRAAAWDDSAQSDSPCARRYNKLWVKNQNFSEALAYWRNIRTERAFTASLDINRVLFSYGG